jgi:putative thiamine transport system ATP-binding protein
MAWPAKAVSIMSLQVSIQELRTPTQYLVRDLRLDCPSGRITTLMGPSGCGKSSVLALIAGQLPYGLSCRANVQLNGQSLDALPAQLRRVGMLFQDDLLFPHMNVLENLLFALPPGAREQRERQARAALEQAGLAAFALADPATLSGGQRARVALMRALLAKPQALLLDEPYSKLDATLRAQFREFVASHVRAQNIPALLVTHDQADVADSTLLVRMEVLHA